jgi:hypothetical protein
MNCTYIKAYSQYYNWNNKSVLPLEKFVSLSYTSGWIGIIESFKNISTSISFSVYDKVISHLNCLTPQRSSMYEY